MLQISNQTLFNQIVNNAIAKVQNDKRWANAIRKAVGKVEDESQVCFMDFHAETNQLIIWSQGSDKVYSSNGVCQCEAYANGFPCWHRALARLMRLYTESINAVKSKVDDRTEQNNALYYKPETKHSEKIGRFRI
jgi:hypothetical protein